MSKLPTVVNRIYLIECAGEADTTWWVSLVSPRMFFNKKSGQREVQKRNLDPGIMRYRLAKFIRSSALKETK